jgi:hypothetical protein
MEKKFLFYFYNHHCCGDYRGTYTIQEAKEFAIKLSKAMHRKTYAYIYEYWDVNTHKSFGVTEKVGDSWIFKTTIEEPSPKYKVGDIVKYVKSGKYGVKTNTEFAITTVEWVYTRHKYTGLIDGYCAIFREEDLVLVSEK